MKAKNYALHTAFAIFLGAVLTFCAIFGCMFVKTNVSAEGELPDGIEEKALIVSEEIEEGGQSLWDTQGYEIRSESGTYTDSEGNEYPYTTKMKFSKYYNNYSSFDIGFTSQDGTYITGNKSFKDSSYFIATSTDTNVIEWKTGSSYHYKFRFILTGNEGTAVLIKHVFNSETHTSDTYVGTARILVEVVDTALPFTFGAKAVTTDAENQVRIAYASPSADEESGWPAAQGSRASTKEFFDHIKINDVSLNDLLDAGNDIQVNFWQTSFEIYYLKDGSTVPFSAGDTLIFEQGLRMIERDENTNFVYIGQTGYKYVTLSQTQEYTFDGTSWSVEASSVAGITLDKQSYTLDVAETVQLTATLEAGSKADNTVTYISDNQSVATVDQNGLVTAVADGTAKITAKTSNDLTAVCTITVDSASISGVSVNPEAVTVQVGKSATATATVSGASNASQQVTWTVADDTIATVENGVITGVKAGTTTVTVTSAADSTKTATVQVTVVEPVKITASVTEITVEEGKTETVTATVTGADNTAVTWTVADDTIATVENGVITGVKAGMTTVTVTSAADSTKVVTIAVTVTAAEQPDDPEQPDDSEQPTTPSDSDDKTEGGCGSAIAATSVATGSLLLALALIPLTVRRKKDN